MLQSRLSGISSKSRPNKDNRVLACVKIIGHQFIRQQYYNKLRLF